MTETVTLPEVTVARIMRRSPATIVGTSGIREALATMNCRGIRHLIVVSETDKLIGIISQRDILRHLAQTGCRSTLIGDVMTAPAIWCDPEISVAEAARILCKKRIGCLPVLSVSGKVIGIITRSDLLEAASLPE